MSRLDKLEELAQKAADETGKQGFLIAKERIDFLECCDPKTIIRLIASLRKAREVIEVCNDRLCTEDNCRYNNPCFTCAALDELEKEWG